MKRISFATLFIICLLNVAFSQLQRSHWFFGDSAGIVFTANGPVADTNGVAFALTYSSCYSDSNGNLLFYYGGDISWNDNFDNVYSKEHHVMQNGDSLMGSFEYSQGTIIIPFPGNDTLFYLFHSPFDFQLNHFVFYYSVINMSLDSGRGVVVSKNNLLCSDSLSCKITAVKHANGRDWWLILHSMQGDKYFTYLITPIGITGPFIQNIGSVFHLFHPNGGFTWSYTGWMMPNKDGNKFVSVNGDGDIDIFDFDRCTGQLSNWTYIGTTNYFNSYDYAYYGCAFDSRNLFLNISTPNSILQFDLTAANIKASQQTIYTMDSAHVFGALLNGIDDKIYVASCNLYFANLVNPIFDSINMNLSVINYPYLPYPACDFIPFSVSLGGKSCILGLPNMPFYELGTMDSSLCDSLTSINEYSQDNSKLRIYPNPTSGIINIDITLSKYSRASISIQNTLGEVLQSNDLSVGNNITRFDYSRFDSGIYFYIISIDRKMVSSGKVLIIK